MTTTQATASFLGAFNVLPAEEKRAVIQYMIQMKIFIRPDGYPC